MTDRPVDRLIETLSAEIRPVTPLAPPWRRAAATLAAFAVAGGVAIATSDPGVLLARHAGRELQLALELSAILLTGLLAVTAAFFAAVPGRSRLWLAAPLPPLLVWLLLSGAGCFAASADDPASHGSLRCFVFITATSAGLAVPLIWRLSLAAPLHALRVALLAGLGSAALSAFLLAFFHPFDVTFLDLAVHLAAILLVTGTLALLRGPTLRPA